ncbi:MAG: hypothetical protein F6J93_11305 [Oscillatoria sp. SIO1A7]|nr:hypothetical protein [Oscillatoria sp. SIO1A7]
MNENVGATASPEPSRLYNGNFRTGCFAPDTLHQFEKRYSHDENEKLPFP